MPSNHLTRALLNHHILSVSTLNLPRHSFPLSDVGPALILERTQPPTQFTTVILEPILQTGRHHCSQLVQGVRFHAALLSLHYQRIFLGSRLRFRGGTSLVPHSGGRTCFLNGCLGCPVLNLVNCLAAHGRLLP